MSLDHKTINTFAKECTYLTIRELISENYIWNSFVQTAPSSCFMQAWDWADFKELEGYKTFRYGLFLNKELVGGCIFYLYPNSSKTNLLIAPGGPMLSAKCSGKGMQLLLKKASLIAKEMGAIALRIEPLWTQKLNYLTGFVRAPADMLPSETLLIDLRPPESKILAEMKPKGRYNLRLSWRYGVETEFRNDSQAIPLFYNLFWETVQRQQFFGEPYGFFINLCQTLFPANMAEIGLASWRGEILAAILVVYWGDRATYLYGGRSLNHPEVMANYALHFRAMQRAKMRGCQCYDFYGFTRDPYHAYAKFSQFKSQFGGVPITTIGAHDYFFYDQLADTLINLFQNLAGDKKMNQVLLLGFTQSGLIVLELAVGFGLFWLGQLAYQKLFRRRMELNLELFVKDNPAVAIALVGYYLGIVIALGGVLGQSADSWQDKLLNLATYGATAILFMLAGAWVGDYLILRNFRCDREIIQERNVGAATVEAGNHIADGLILNAALAGESGGWLVALICWLIGLGVLVLVSVVYPHVTRYDVFAQIQKRNNPAAGVALAGLLIATGNIVRVAFTAEYQNWILSFTEYGLVLLFCLALLIAIRWLADLILVPGVKISDEIVNQEIPNLGAGLIEAFSYIAASFLIAWCFA